MYVNKTCSLIQTDLFEYDFSACSYNILKATGWDVSDIPADNKKLRSIKIGLLQKSNPRLSSYITYSMNNLVDYYLDINKIDKKDVILRQKDGIVIKRPLKISDMTMPIELRHHVSKLILSVDRKSWLLIYSNQQVVAKGIGNLPVDISFYQMFNYIDFSSCKSISLGIDGIRKNIHNATNPLWFCREGENGNINIPLKGMGIISLPRSVASGMDTNDIEKSFLWSEYIWPFCRSLLVHCVNKG